MAWNLNLMPFTGPQFTAAGFASLAGGISEALQKRQEAAAEAEKLQYENVKSQSIMNNLAKNGLITPEEMLEFQNSNPKKAKALADAATANVAFNMMQEKNRPVPPSIGTLPNPTGTNPITYFQPGGTGSNAASIVPTEKTPVAPGVVALPVAPELQAQGLPKTMPALQQPSGAVQPITMPAPTPAKANTREQAPNGQWIEYDLKGMPHPLAFPQNKLDVPPEKIAELEKKTGKIAVPQSNGALIWFDDPSVEKKDKPDTLGSIEADALALDKLKDAGAITERKEAIANDLLGKRLRQLAKTSGVSIPPSAKATPTPSPTPRPTATPASVTTPNLPTTPVPPQVRSVEEAKNLPSDIPTFYDPQGRLFKNPNYKPPK